MTDGFAVVVGDEAITVIIEDFTLVFDKDNVGLTSFKYLKGEHWHEGVKDGGDSPILFGPYFYSQKLNGQYLYPMDGASIEVSVETPWFVHIRQMGYLGNEVLGESTDFPFEAAWRIWPCGKIACRFKTKNDSGETVELDELAIRLNPYDDADITPGRDDGSPIEWLGFFSNNTGDGKYDLSHDGIAVPYQDDFVNYGVSGKANRIYVEDYDWPDSWELAYEFLLALSGNGSWGDVAGAVDFQARGDAIGLDYRNPDPLNGAPNAGRVLVGSGTFNEELGAYKLQV